MVGLLANMSKMPTAVDTQPIFLTPVAEIPARACPAIRKEGRHRQQHLATIATNRVQH